ncbi:MAG: hypothetical protein L0Z62_10000 [Gemmataceae bacterium]|nr:hypothetical protein [Gemmataceae bacterium]
MTPTRSSRRRAAYRRRGLHVVLWTGGLFVAAQLLGGLLLDHVWPQVRFPQAGKVWTRLDHLPRPPEIVILGSSRMQGGVSTAVLGPLLREFDPEPRAFNAGVGAGDALVADWLLARMLREGRCPRLVVMEVSPETVASYNRWLEQHVIRHLTWTDLCALFPEVRRSTHPMRLLSSRLMPLYMHRHHLRRYLAESALAALTGSSEPQESDDADESGADPADDAVALRTGVGEALHTAGLDEFERWLRNYRVGGGATEALERLLGRCREQGIAVVLVAPPMSVAHRRLYTPEIDGAFRGYVEALARAHGFRFHDFRDWLPDHLFRDHHHTNVRGSAIFTRLLAREALIPAWRERTQAAP